MKLKKFVVILVIIYLILFMLRFMTLSEIDRYNISNMAKYPFKNKCDSPMFLSRFISLLKFPFKDKDYLSKVSEGALYCSYHLNRSNFQKLDNKIYWSQLFKSNHINHPKIICYRMKGADKIRLVEKIKPYKEYIIKPIYGTLGTSVLKIRGYDVLETLKHNDNKVVQELLNDCYVKGARHFRFVSFYNGVKFNIAELSNENRIASNHILGGNTVNCKNFKCISLNKDQQIKIDKITDKLARIHKKEFNQAFSIGWDIMLNCETDKVKAYCLEGNLIHSTWFYPENVNENIREKYIREADKFMRLNGYY